MAQNSAITCCFTGHRVIPKEQMENIERQTKEVCENLIRKGYRVFIAGGALGFDTICAKCVLELREIYEDIKLVIAVPCKEQDKGWSKADSEIYHNILNMADEVKLVSEHYTAGCMQKRNRFMVDNSSVCVAYLKKMRGGTAYTVSYASDCGAEIIFVGNL